MLPSTIAGPTNMDWETWEIALKVAVATPTPTPTVMPTASPSPTPNLAVCSRFPACLPITAGSYAAEQPPPFISSYPDNYECCSILRPPQVCQYQSATCFYVNNW